MTAMEVKLCGNCKMFVELEQMVETRTTKDMVSLVILRHRTKVMNTANKASSYALSTPTQGKISPITLLLARGGPMIWVMPYTMESVLKA